jgi:hypothetical protein
MSGGGETGNQCAVEVEERAHLGARRTNGDFRDRVRHRLRIVDGHVVVL